MREVWAVGRVERKSVRVQVQVKEKVLVAYRVGSASV